MINSNVRDMFNVDPVTGIAYGYINANNVNYEVLNNIISNGIDASRLACDLDFARRFGFHSPEQKDGENYFDYLGRVNNNMLDFLNSKEEIADMVEDHDREFEYFSGDRHVSCIDGTTTIFMTDSNMLCVLDSSVTGMYYACSPCCPNAGDLDSAGGDVETYDVPASWRDLDY